MNPKKVTERFSDRVENYVKYRPSYPPQIITFLRSELALTPAHVIADVGSGTGILTRLFLANGNTVFGIEPNARMREAGEAFLAEFPAFKGVNATAEHTTLQTCSVDFVTAGQAFHWFSHEEARAEFNRVLRPRGHVALVWNDRRETSDFADDYEQLLQTYGTDYKQVSLKYRGDDTAVKHFFREGWVKLKIFENAQILDFDSLVGRVLSSSYAPLPEHPNYEPMIKGLRNLFDRYQREGAVRMEYDTTLYYGQLTQ